MSASKAHKSPGNKKVVEPRHGSVDKGATRTKVEFMKELQDSKKINVAELLKKKLRKDVGIVSTDMEKYVNAIITREVNAFLNSKESAFSVQALKEVK